MILGPGATLGILGDGQLGRMLGIEARRMGYRTSVYGSTRDGPAGQIADSFTRGALNDKEKARAWATGCDVITLETEHISADLLATVENVRPLHPGSQVLTTIHDRLAQKTFLKRNGIPQANFAPFDPEMNFESGTVGFPAVVKSRTEGYDGKGQFRVTSQNDLASVNVALAGRPAIVESMITYEREISVILARDVTGNTMCFPIAENEHRNHILHMTRVPARIDSAMQARARELATAIAEELGHVGVMAVEMFAMPDGGLLVNEIAPRVHNSGHYTLGACVTSQFEQHIRAICGLPLGETALLRPAAMVNLLGDSWLDDPGFFDDLLKTPDVKLHLYGKQTPRRGRKMGHATIVKESAEEAVTIANRLAEILARKSAGNATEATT